jgi:bifunctional DNA-binding transcriptional regulator/antitoxin component of YhaV-PrlF toxin-antitoxin module
MEQAMPKARVRNGELTLPLSDEIREKLDIRDGDELEAHVFKGSVSFTPTSPAARERAWEDIFSIIDKVRLRPGQRSLTEDEIVAEVRAVRRARRARQHD